MGWGGVFGGGVIANMLEGGLERRGSCACYLEEGAGWKGCEWYMDGEGGVPEGE